MGVCVCVIVLLRVLVLLGVVVDEAVDVTVLEIVLVLLPERDAVLLGVLELDAVLDPVVEGVFV